MSKRIKIHAVTQTDAQNVSVQFKRGRKEYTLWIYFREGGIKLQVDDGGPTTYDPPSIDWDEMEDA